MLALVGAPSATSLTPVSVWFEANHGQSSDHFDAFLSFGGNGAVAVRRDALIVRSPDGERTTFEFVGVSTHAQLEGEDVLPGYANHFIGNDPRRHVVHATRYAKVRVRDLYHAIDLVVYATQRTLEFDLELHPGANPDDVRMAVESDEPVGFSVDGGLVLRNRPGHLFTAPAQVFGQASDFGLGFARDADGFVRLRGKHVSPLTALVVVDPTLLFSSYVGGSDFDGVTDVAVDSTGSFIAVGSTSSTDIASTRSGPTPPTGTRDTFIAKYTSNGQLSWITQFGGSQSVAAQTVVVEGSDRITFAGDTQATDLPTATGYTIGGLSGPTDVFLATLAPSGAELIHREYIGGAGYEDTPRLAYAPFGPGGRLYLMFRTWSNDLPVVNGFSAYTGAGELSVYVRIGERGLGPLLATYFGGQGSDYPGDIAVAPNGSVCVAFLTYPTVPPGAEVPTFNALTATRPGGEDIVAVRIAPDLSLAFATYLGGSALDIPAAVAAAANGDCIFAGRTDSSNYPVSPGTGLYPLPRGREGVITRILADGSGYAFSTHLGGEALDNINSLAVRGNELFLLGETESNDFPVTANAFSSARTGGRDIWVGRMPADGSQQMTYATYFGSQGDDYSGGLAVDSFGRMFVGLSNDLTSALPLLNAADPVGSGSYEGAVALFGELAPALTGVSPIGGPPAGGTNAILSGSNFTPSSVVRFGAQVLATTYVSPTSLSVVSPAGLVNTTVDVSVTNADGQSTKLVAAFRYSDPPTLALVAPASGPQAGGTALQVTGTNFQAGATVFVAGVAATSVVVVSSTLITAVSAAAPTAGLADVVVRNPDAQQALAVGAFRLVAAPTITSVSPTVVDAAGGTLVEIVGSNIDPGATVRFGGLDAKFCAVNGMTWTCTTPAADPGPAPIVITNTDGQTATFAEFSFVVVEEATPADLNVGQQPKKGCSASGDDSGATLVLALLLLLGLRRRHR